MEAKKSSQADLLTSQRIETDKILFRPTIFIGRNKICRSKQNLSVGTKFVGRNKICRSEQNLVFLRNATNIELSDACVRAYMRAYVRTCVRICVCVCAYVRAYVRACVRIYVCVCACVCVSSRWPHCVGHGLTVTELLNAMHFECVRVRLL